MIGRRELTCVFSEVCFRFSCVFSGVFLAVFFHLSFSWTKLEFGWLQTAKNLLKPSIKRCSYDVENFRSTKLNFCLRQSF